MSDASTEYVNRRITEDVMGECWHEVTKTKMDDHGAVSGFTMVSVCKNCGKTALRNKNYATDIADAWKVVEWMEVRGCVVYISNPMNGQSYWECGFVNPAKYAERLLAELSPPIMKRESSELAPMAICLAALKTVEGKCG